ncbi:MAG: cysteine--tRNA ligase [Nitrososphaerota archaeon]|jgi:cysteinyl-tRNA synthetase|nr:cysteine--tRNA ligase [Nitrososphaerota archaeon]
MTTTTPTPTTTTTITNATALCVFNTLTRTKQEFTPQTPGEVKLYTCGPTVYDYAHIGNFRAFLFEDLLKRWLKYNQYKVTHIMNLTDIDDKTIKGSQAKNQSLQQFTEFYINAFFEDIKTLNIQPADCYPKATDHIPEMISLIKTLLSKNIAYRGEDQSIYFSVAKFPDYGKLSHLKVGELKAGARVSQDEYTKEEAQDFALWKAWTPQDGEVYWETELGKGRPGWHIECSAMSMKYLGASFDIHCGGIDNMFPHHENEIAQSEAATGKKFVDYWMHNEHLQVEGKKMSKRLGNFYTLRDLLSRGYDPSAIRYLLISTHYRQQFNFTLEGLQSATTTIERLRTFVRRLQEVQTQTADPSKPTELMGRLQEQFSNAMNDDLNIAIALAGLFEFVREFNSLLDANLVNTPEATKALETIMQLDAVLGVIGKVEATEALSGDIDALVQKREEARRAKNWKEADAIRDQLKAMGIVLEDTAQGIRWYKTKSS